MLKLRSFRRYTKKQYVGIWLIILSFYAFYIEYYCYFTNVSNWLEPQCDNQKDCIRILLVADPQIIGIKSEILHFLTPISIYDSDQYLKKTYHYAFNFVKPDIVIFLGDLMDEGSSATTKEFYEYVRRLFNIFLQQSTSNVQHIWIPGDNDIGGEEFDGVTNDKLKRFYRAFAQPELITYKNITFFKINRLIQSIPIFKEQREFYDTSKIFIGLSHLPLLFMPSLFVEKVFKKMLPQVLFTAHEHKAMIVSTDALLRQDRQIIPITPDNNKIYEYSLGSADMYEFIIPTCSYRMGTDKIGYGYVVLEKNYLRFTVLWSPSRFKQLSSYLTLLICFVLCSLFITCCRCLLRF